jgi:type IV pilus assembly protein PilM
MVLSLGFGSQSLLVIDPGRHTLKVGVGSVGVKGRSAKLQSVYTVETGATPDKTPDEIVERTGVLIQEILKRHSLSAKQVSFAIPGRASFVRQLRVPRVSGDRLSRLIQYEARQQIPFPIEDIILDSHIFESDGPELGVTLVAIRKSIIDQYCEMLRTAGLVPDVIDVTTLSLFDAYYPLFKQEEEEVVALVDIGASTTDIAVCRKGRLEFIRSAPQAGDTLTKVLVDNLRLSWEEAEQLKRDAGELDPSIDRQTDPLSFGEADRVARAKLFMSKAFDLIANEIRRTLDFYISQPEGEPIGKIFLTGGGAHTPGIEDFVFNRLGIPCEAKSPFDQTLVNVEDLQVGPLRHTCSVLLGQCQRNIGDTPLRMNFLPPAIVRRKAFEKRRAILVAEGVLLAVLISFSVVTLQRKIDVIGQANFALQDKLEGKGEEAARIKDYTTQTVLLEERVSTLQNVGRNRGVISRTIAAVAENFPLGHTWLTRIDVDTSNIIMNAKGGRPQDVGAFKEDLQEVANLRNLTISEQKREPSAVGFTATALIEKNPSPEVSKLREKLENRGITPYELYFQDYSSVPGAKQQFLVTILVPEALNDAERTNMVMDILNAAADADLGFEQENFQIIFQNFQRVQTGEYMLLHPVPNDLRKGTADLADQAFKTTEV